MRLPVIAPLRWLVDLVLPPRCLGCGVGVGAQGTFCAECWASLRFLGPEEGCARCGEPTEAGGVVPFVPWSGWQCAGCLADPPPFSQARSVFLYGGAVRQAVLAFKHGDRTEYARVLARYMAQSAAGLLSGPGSGPDSGPPAVLVPVPLHRWRLWRRGFNQAALLARELARLTGRPWLPDALVRVRATASQQGLSRAERRRNLSGAFRVTEAGRRGIAGRVVVLVDDVLTTGSTVRRCARALLAAGAREVRVMTLARVGAGGAAERGGLSEGAVPSPRLAMQAAPIHIGRVITRTGVTGSEGVPRGDR